MLVKNIIVVGDSFCANQHMWPAELAKYLGLNLVGQGIGGASWWPSRQFLISLPQTTIDNTEVMVFAHTNSGRIPTLNNKLVSFDHSVEPQSEIEKAVNLYYKYISDQQFMDWAQQQWLLEIAQQWGHKKLCHLHCFPWTTDYQNLMAGLVVQPNLSAISLNEISAKKFDLFDDCRLNHLNQHNNKALAQELARMIQSDSIGIHNLNLELFDQPTQRWLDWR
jgi:hypothetical protein